MRLINPNQLPAHGLPVLLPPKRCLTRVSRVRMRWSGEAALSFRNCVYRWRQKTVTQRGGTCIN
jgi:hypothetical protein